MHDLPGYIVLRLNAKALSRHGKVWILIGSQQVVGPEAWVKALIGPDAAYRGIRIEDGEGMLWVSDVVLFRGAEAVVAFVVICQLYVGATTGETYRLRRRPDRIPPWVVGATRKMSI